MKPPGQSDFRVELPEARVEDTSGQASEGATKWMLRLTMFMLLVLALLLVIGPHIPSGE